LPSFFEKGIVGLPQKLASLQSDFQFAAEKDVVRLRILLSLSLSLSHSEEEVHQRSCATTVCRAKQSSFRADSCEQVRDGYYYVKQKSTERAGKLCLCGMVT
jgi:hypothetical protein